MREAQRQPVKWTLLLSSLIMVFILLGIAEARQPNASSDNKKGEKKPM